MLNEKLNSEIFSDKVEMKSTRDGFGNGLLLAGEENSNVVALSADVAASTRCTAFIEKFPERFFQIGIAEQNLIGVAAGLAVSGKIPFTAAYAVFTPGRTWEQIRTMIAYNNANVKVVGHHSGLHAGLDGATHQSLEDIALMRVIPNMKVIVPCDAIEAKKATIAAAKTEGPIYIRVTREKSPIITIEKTDFEIGKAEIFWQSKPHNRTSLLRSKNPQVLIIGCGPVLYNALLAVQELEKEGINAIVLNNHTIKPIDEKKIIELAEKCGAVVTIEDHNIIGGLGGAVAEVLVKNKPMPMEFIGVKDCFTESGHPEELVKKYGLGIEDIKAAAKKVIGRK